MRKETRKEGFIVMRTFTTRLLHVFLAVVLCVSMAPHVAFADTTPSTGITVQETSQAPNKDKQPVPANSSQGPTNSLQGKTSAPEAVNSTSAQASTQASTSGAPAAQQGANAVPASKNDTAGIAAATPDGNASSNYSEALPSNPANQGAQNQDEHGNSVNSPSNLCAASSAATQNQQAQAQNSTAVRASSDEGDGSDNPTSDGDGQDDYGVKPDDVCPNNEPDPYLPGSEPKFYSAADLSDGTYSVTANISILTPIGARGYTTSPVNPVGIGPRGIPTAPLTYNATLKVNQGVYELSIDLLNPAFTVQEVSSGSTIEVKSLHTSPIPKSPAVGADMGHNANIAKPGSPKTRIDHLDLVLKNHSGLYQFGSGRSGWRVFATPLDMWIPNCDGEPSHSLDVTVDLKNARLLGNASGTKVFADNANKTRVELSFTTQSTHIADINAGKLLVHMTPLTNEQDIQYWVNSLHSYYSDIKADSGVRLYSLNARNNNTDIPFDLGMSAKVQLPLVHADDKVVFLDSQGAHELSGQRETVGSTSFITVTVHDTGIFYVVPKQVASKQLYTLCSPRDNDTHVRTVLSYGDPVRSDEASDEDYLQLKAYVTTSFDAMRDFAKIKVKTTPLNNVNDFGVTDALRATSYGIATYGKAPGATVATPVVRADLSGSSAEMFLDLTYTLPTSTGQAQVFALLSDTSGKQYGKCKLSSLSFGNSVSVSLNENQANIDALLKGIISDEEAAQFGKAAFDTLVFNGTIYGSTSSDFEGLPSLHSKDGATLIASLVVVDTGKKIKQPKPQVNLLYSGQKQHVLTSTDEFDVEGASATEPGVYEAVVTPKRGFVWEDGTTTPYKFTWQIMNSDTSGHGGLPPVTPGGQGGDHNQGTQPEQPAGGEQQSSGDGVIKPGTYTVSANIWFDKHDTGLPLNPHITNPGFPPKDPVAKNARLTVNDNGEASVTVPISIQPKIMHIKNISGLNITNTQTRSDSSSSGDDITSITVNLGKLNPGQTSVTIPCSVQVHLGDLAFQMVASLVGGTRDHNWPATFNMRMSGLPSSGGGAIPPALRDKLNQILSGNQQPGTSDDQTAQAQSGSDLTNFTPGTLGIAAKKGVSVEVNGTLVKQSDAASGLVDAQQSLGAGNVAVEGILEGPNVPDGSVCNITTSALDSVQVASVAPAIMQVLDKELADPQAVAGVFDVSLNVNNTPVHDNFGNLVLSFPVSPEYNGKQVKVWHFHTNNTVTSEICTVKDGRFSIAVSDLSKFAYALLENVKQDAQKATQNPQAIDASSVPAVPGDADQNAQGGAGISGADASANHIAAGTYTVSANIWFDKHDTGLPLNPHITNPGFPPMNPVANNARLVVNEAGEGWVTIPIAIQSRIMTIQSISGLNITQSDYSDGGLRSITVYLGVLSGNRAAIVKHCSATARIGDLAMTIAGAVFKGERMHTWPATFSLNFSGLPRSGGGRVPDVVKNYMAGAGANTVANAEEAALDALGDSSVTPQNDADTSTRAQAKSKGIAPNQSATMNASTVAGIVVVVLALAALCAYAIVRSRKLRQQFTKFDDSERGPSQH